MDPFDQQRRSLLVALAGLGIGPVLPQRSAAAQPGVQRGYVLGTAKGEHLVHFRDGGNIFVKLGAATGSSDLAAGTQQVMVGTGIPIHRHFRMDEAFYVLEGSGNVLLDDVRHDFERGAFDLHSEEHVARVRESSPRTPASLDRVAGGS
jgi:hypothetical protein